VLGSQTNELRKNFKLLFKKKKFQTDIASYFLLKKLLSLSPLCHPPIAMLV
jgi:hypothetical protein